MINKIHYQDELPIVAAREEIVQAIRIHPVVVVAGDTGSGKTTQLPKMCLEAGRGVAGLIGCTQPRRIAAITVAERVAEELGSEAAGVTGYKIRFQDRTGSATRIKFMTDGILLAEAQHDRLLRTYDTIIVDEAHERSLNIDFLLGMLKRLLARRDDLKLIITSATIDTAKFAKNFNDAPVIQVAGRTFPVEVRYQPGGEGEEEEATHIDLALQAVAKLRREERPGDTLIFMPTERDIRETVDGLTDLLRHEKPGSRGWPQQTAILPLFGRLAAADQRRVFRTGGPTKIVVATNVAETSVTVPGIRYCIDTGLARIAHYNVRARTTTMPVARISRASADQRKGRCGRVGAGVCIRLYAEEDYAGRPEYTQPEILRANLAEVILRMTALKLGDPATFPFIDPPSPRAIRDGYAQLHELGAIDQHRQLTHRGRLMARLPLDPRISRMIIEARDHNALREVTVIAAALSIQDPRIRPADKEAEADKIHNRFAADNSDFLSSLNLWDTYHNTLAKVASSGKMRKFCQSHYLSHQRMREWRDIHEQISNILAEDKNFLVNELPADYDAIHQSILSGTLRNIGLKKEKNIYLGAQSKELVLFPGSNLYNKGGQWIMAAELVETSRLFARTAATIKPEWLEPMAGDLCRSSYSAPHWEKKRGQVTATERVTLFGLTIVAGRKINYGRIKPDEARQLFIQSALIEGELNGRYPFLDHNLELMKSLQEMEDRLRQRDILADEQTLYRFYDQRLPAGVFDQAGLNRFLKEPGGDSILRMEREEILGQAPAGAALDDFPTTLAMGEFALPLSYTFAPGAEDDGVTVTVPVELLAHVRPELCQWLVPGLLLDKITLLLKSLPKNLRKQLIPVAQTAEELLGDLAFCQGSFYQALEEAIHRRYRVRIEREQWAGETLPDHLRMRYRLVDMQGRTLAKSRNFADLTATPTPASSGDELVRLKQKWERNRISSWDFAGLPERITILGPDRQLRGFAYPALTEDGEGTVGVRLTTSEAESRTMSRQGVRLLYQLQFASHMKNLKKDLTLPRRQWQLYEGLGTEEEINRALLAFALETVFDCRDGLIPDQETFTTKIEAIRQKGLYPMAKAVMDTVLEVLIERRQTLDVLAKHLAMAAAPAKAGDRFAGYRRQADGILPANFLADLTPQQLAAAGRYFRALRIRMERAHLDPAKDTAKANQAIPFSERLNNLPDLRGKSPEWQRLLAEYRQMLEEFKVSLFAPEMKTAFPVSAKRLEKKWQELERAG